MKVYPNPATAAVYFELPQSGDFTIKIMDITGRLMNTADFTANTTGVMSVKNYPPGMYIYQVITNGKITAGKLQVD